MVLQPVPYKFASYFLLVDECQISFIKYYGMKADMNGSFDEQMKTEDHKIKPSFTGYGQPHYTSIPDIFLDEQMQNLGEAEIKVMLYIFRRTYGWKKEVDAISYSQFLNGIITRNGRRLDHGAGITKRSLLRSLNTLVHLGYIFRHTRYGTDGRCLTTIYELNIDGVPHWCEKGEGARSIPSPGPEIHPPLVSQVYPPTGAEMHHTIDSFNQKTVNQNTSTDSDCEALCLELEELGLSDSMALNLVKIALKNGRTTGYIRSWREWLSTQPNILNPAAYLIRVVRENANPPSFPTASTPHQNGNHKPIDFSKYGPGGKYHHLLSSSNDTLDINE